MARQPFQANMILELYNLLHFVLGFALFNHGLGSWIVSRISYLEYRSVLNWPFVYLILATALAANGVMFHARANPGPRIIRGLVAFLAGALCVSAVYLVRVGL